MDAEIQPGLFTIGLGALTNIFKRNIAFRLFATQAADICLRIRCPGNKTFPKSHNQSSDHSVQYIARPFRVWPSSQLVCLVAHMSTVSSMRGRIL